MSKEIIGYTPNFKGNKSLLRVRHYPSWVASLFGVKPKDKEFIGGCTVWYSYPDFNRVGTAGEWSLNNMEQRMIHQYPDGYCSVKQYQH